MSEVDETIGYVEEWLNGDEGSGVLNDRVIYPELLAEIRRLRSAVGAVRALPKQNYGGDHVLNRDDVLAALEGE